MSRYLSFIYLYCRASGKKLAVLTLLIPLCLAAVRALQPDFGGILPVLVIMAAFFGFLSLLLRSLKGGRAIAITGFTVRRLMISPLGAYFTILVFCLAIVIVFWAAAVTSLLIIGRLTVEGGGSSEANTLLTLMILRTDLGHALIPVGHGYVLVFNILVTVALAGECARSCYLGWHNGRQSAGMLLILAAMFYVWCCRPGDSFISLAIMFTALYSACIIGDVIFREKRPKGDFFVVNRYTGILDMDSEDFSEDVRLEVNSLVTPVCGRSEISFRQRLMPPGINMEKANYLLAGGIALGFAENLLFFGRFMINLQEIRISGSGYMAYFNSLMEYSCLGYAGAMLLVPVLQAYWNYCYYNKETKSVYVMKRLPDRSLYSRSIWAVPVLEAMIICAVMLANAAADFLIYLIVTPDTALRPDYLYHILPFTGG